MFFNLIYAALLWVVWPLLLIRSLRTGKYRDRPGERLGHVPARQGGRPCVWLHAVSLGEMRAGRTLVPALAAARPDVDIVLSTTTETGREEAGRLHPGRPVFWWPLDFTGCVERTLSRVRPDVVVLLELEVWPNFVEAARRAGVRVVVLNGRITPKSAAGYARAGRVLRRMFATLWSVCVQTESYARRFAGLGVRPDRLRVVPNLKYDTADAPPPAEPERFAAEIGLRAGERLLVAGSTGPGEEAALLEAWMTLRAGGRSDLRLALVPRHPQRFDEVAGLIAARGLGVVRRSAGPAVPTTEHGCGAGASPSAVPPVILGDTMGELRRFYAAGTVAFLGRSLIPAGGSDMAEAAALRRPVVFGPHVANFEDTVECLLAAGGAVQVRSAEELVPAVAELLDDPTRAADIAARGLAALQGRRGGTAASLSAVLAALDAGA